MDPAYPRQPAARPHSIENGHHSPPNFAPQRQAPSREPRNSHAFLPAVDVEGSTRGLDAVNLSRFRSAYAGPGFNGLDQHDHAQQPPQRKQLPAQPQPHHSRGLSLATASADAAPSSLGQFGILAPAPVGSYAGPDMLLTAGSGALRPSPANDSGSSEPSQGPQPATKFVENPPDLIRWRQRLFDLEAPVILSEAE